MRCSVNFRSVNRRSFAKVWLAASVACLLLATATVRAEYTYTTFSDLEAINADGTNAWPGAAGNHPIVVYGTIINNPSDMTNDPNNWWQAALLPKQ